MLLFCFNTPHQASIKIDFYTNNWQVYWYKILLIKNGKKIFTIVSMSFLNPVH